MVNFGSITSAIRQSLTSLESDLYYSTSDASSQQVSNSTRCETISRVTESAVTEEKAHRDDTETLVSCRDDYYLRDHYKSWRKHQKF